MVLRLARSWAKANLKAIIAERARSHPRDVAPRRGDQTRRAQSRVRALPHSTAASLPPTTTPPLSTPALGVSLGYLLH